MKKLIIILLAVSICSGFSGCATVFSGGSEDISLDSDPTGAEVYIDGKKEGTTPMKFSAKKGKEYNFQFTKAGYEFKNFNLLYSLGVGWVILDVFLSGIIGVVIDAVTGNWNGFDVESYKAVLELKKESAK